jgi:integrase/recombinase XerD
MRQGFRGVPLKHLMHIEKAGKTYWYFRRKGHKPVRLPDPSDPGFAAAYAAALAPHAPPPKAAPGTVAALIEATRRSERFLSVSATYRKTLARHFDAIRAEGGDAPARGIREEHIRANVHGSRNPTDRLKAWRFLCAFGLDVGLLKADHSVAVPAVSRPKTVGLEPWTAAEKEAFRARWPIGTVPRAAMELLNWTGFRIGDAVMIGPGHIDRSGVLIFAQSKVKEPAFVPWTCPVPDSAADDAWERDLMHQALAALGRRQMTFLATAGGRTRSEKALGNMIRDAAREAGVEKSAHGLRKTRGISLAEGGSGAHGIMAWLGHQTLKEAEHYTKLASRRRAVLGHERNGNGANFSGDGRTAAKTGS